MRHAITIRQAIEALNGQRPMSREKADSIVGLLNDLFGLYETGPKMGVGPFAAEVEGDTLRKFVFVPNARSPKPEAAPPPTPTKRGRSRKSKPEGQSDEGQD